MRRCTADVIGLDWHTEMHEARSALGWDRVLQGNVDPMLLFAPEVSDCTLPDSLA
jgi:uroporphyrinogen decarboxylase